MMRKTKWIVSGMLFVVMFLCAIIGMAALAVSAETADEPDSEVYYGRVNRSIELYDQAMAPFIVQTRSLNVTNDEYEADYSDEFAGVFIDDEGFLNIGVTGSTNRFSDFNGQVFYKKFDHSYNFLLTVQESITGIMNSVDIHRVSIDEKNNEVDVYLQEEDIDQVIGYLQSKNLFNDSSIEFIVDSNGEYEEYAADIAYGGEALRVFPDTDLSVIHLGTITVNAIDNETGQLGILTCEHVARTDNEPKAALVAYGEHFDHTNNTYNKLIMIGPGSKGYQGGTIDAAFVPFDNQYNENGWEATPNARYNGETFTNVKLGDESYIIQGRPVMQIGQTTGVTYGKIQNAINSVNIEGIILTKAIITDIASQGGDSGGPLYFDDGTNNELRLIGMVFGGSSSGGTSASCRIREVMNILGVTPITNEFLTTTNLSNNKIRIDGLQFDYQGKLEIPSVYKGRVVTEINSNAFSNQKSLREVVIPSTVTTIGNAAFMNCINLENVTFGAYSGLYDINSYAFQQCFNLKSIVLSNAIHNVSAGILAYAEQATVYTNLTNIPSGWDNYWNSSAWTSIERPVVWGCTLSSDRTYVVSFNKTSSSITKGTAVNGLSDPYRVGYTFGGWYNNADYTGTAILSNELVNAPNNIRYYAKWIPNHTVTFEYNDGTDTSYTTSVANNDNLCKPVNKPIRLGYIFKYWALSSNLNTEYNWDSKVVEDIVLQAVWQEIGENHVVTFDLNGGESKSNTQELVADGEKVSVPITPTKVGYTFSHWTLTGESSAYNFNTPVTSDITLVAVWQSAQTRTVTFNTNGGEGIFPAITVNQYNSISEPEMEPVRAGYYFKYWALSTNLNQEYDWDTAVSQNITLVAVWDSFKVTITFNANGGSYGLTFLSLNKGDTVGEFTNGLASPTRTGYTFRFWGTSPNASSAYNFNSTVNQSFTLYAVWRINTYSVSFDLSGGTGSCPTQTVDYGSTATRPSDPTRQDYTFKYWALSGQTTEYDFNTPITSNITLVAVWEENPKCIAAGTLVTLADGTQKAVEELTGNEMLLVWNMATGTLDVAPILFIDSDPVAMYSVINLYFSDGTQVKVISEHGFWDYNLNKYVYLDKDAAQYIGHWFNKLSTDENGNSVSEKVQLVNVVIQDEYTTAWSPVTYGHYCYYVNGMLSMPGGIEGMFNIFEVDAETMKYDEAQMQADIAQYGLFTYEEFAELFSVSEEVFEAFNGQYLKVAMGKGLIDAEGLQTLIERYAEFLSAIG